MIRELLRSRALLLLNVQLAVFTFSPGASLAKTSSPNCEQYLGEASHAHGVPLGLLYAVALTETGSGGKLQPYALNVAGEPVVAKSQEEALAAFEKARDAGEELIDLGCMQINYRYHNTEFRSASDMLDPQQNIVYAAKHLKSLQVKHGSWTEAVARYHAGPKNKIAQHRYVCKVLNNLVTMNFGSWTQASKTYCKSKPE